MENAAVEDYVKIPKQEYTLLKEVYRTVKRQAFLVRIDEAERNLAAGLEKLEAWMAANPGRLRAVGPPRYLAYNSPFVPGFLKFGEVQLPVERSE